LPYIGYFQLIAAVDKFVIYDNIKYTKKGWINRNRMLQNGRDVMFTLPLKSDSDALDVRDRVLGADFNPDKLLSQFKNAYRTAPQFDPVFRVLESIVQYGDRNLFRYIHHSVAEICDYLDIATEIQISSQIAIDHSLKSQDKVLALCQALHADTYINTSGGVELYSRADFTERQIELKFIRPKPLSYAQLGNEFVPWLSIIDVLMFHPVEAIQPLLTTHYEFI